MIEVIKVVTKRQQRAFVNFPLHLYKDNPYYNPPLYGDEMAMWNPKKHTYSDVATHQCFLAYKDGKLVGRLQVMIQHQFNEIHKECRARFGRCHFINDQEVVNALFSAGEKWAKEQGMNTICGPLGFSDSEREGLLVEGFDQPQTFEEEYNADYYEKLIKNYGFETECEWVESQIRAPKDQTNYLRLKKISDSVMKLNKLHFAPTKGISKKAYVNKYEDQFFSLLDETYGHLYGYVPWTGKMKDSLKAQFILLINKEYLPFILDENDRVIALGFIIPGITNAVRKSKGHLTPRGIFNILRVVKNPKTVDFGIIGVLPEYQAKGVNAVLLTKLMEFMQQPGIEYGETNLNLTTNHAILSQWKYFDQFQNKRRRSYVKKIA